MTKERKETDLGLGLSWTELKSELSFVTGMLLSISERNRESLHYIPVPFVIKDSGSKNLIGAILL